MFTENLVGVGGSAGVLATATNVQLAQTGASIGAVTSLAGQVVIIRATGERIVAEPGDQVFQDDRFETGSDPSSGVGITFADGSSFSLGADAQLVIDSYVYDPGSDSIMAMNLAQGAFSFVSGQIAKTGESNMTIVTPTATIGVRGTAGAGDGEGVVLLLEPGQQLGEITVTTLGGTVTLTQAYAYTSTANPLAPPSQPVLRPLTEIQGLFGSALRQLPIPLPANENLPPSPDDSGSNDQGERQEDTDTAQESGQPAQDGESSGDDELEFTAEDVEDLAGASANDVIGAIETVADAPDTATDSEDNSPNALWGRPDPSALAPPPPLPSTVPTPLPSSIAVSTPAPFKEPTLSPAEPAPPVASVPGPSVSPPPNTSITINLDASATITLTSGVAETVQLSGPEIAVTVLGQAQDGDRFLDVGNSGAQGLFFSTVASHTFAVNGIENVTFGNMTSGQVHNISLGGTGTVIFNSNSGPFNANVTGDAGNNTFNIGVGISAPSTVNASMGGGTDTVNVNTSVAVTLGLAGVEFLSSTNGSAQNVLFSNAVSGLTVDLGGGFDTLTLANGTNSIHLANVESLIGGTGNDTIFMTQAIAAGTFFDAGIGGLDQITLLGGSTNVGSLANFEFVMGVAGSAEHLTLENSVEGTIFDFGNLADGDSLYLAGGGNILLASNVATIMGGDGDDVIAYHGATSNVTIDGGAGLDSVVNLGAGTSFFTLSNIEHYVGSDGASDRVTLLTEMQSGDIFFGGGVNDNDILNLAGGDNTGTIQFFEFVNGTSGTDDLTLENPIGMTSVQIDLGGGTDTLTLSDFGNTATIKNVEFVFGGAGDDRITVSGTTGTQFNLGAGGDTAAGAVGVGDIFIYTDPNDAAMGAGETITNFEIGLDLIDVSGFAFGSFIFIGGGAFTANSGMVEGRFVDANTLQFDSDDDGNADMEITLSNGVATSLTSSDFIDSGFSV